MNLSILPMQWTGLADLPDVPPVGDDDLHFVFGDRLLNSGRKVFGHGRAD